MKILLVEDNLDLSNSLKEILTLSNYTVSCAYDGEEGFNNAKNNKYDAIIMDIMLPKIDGIEVTKKIREIGVSTPIMMLTAKNKTEDIVTSLDKGADDYMQKPFQMNELLARLRALTRRSSKLIDLTSFYDITINPNVYLIKNKKDKSKQVYLTKKEFLLLQHLIKNENKCSSTQDLIDSIWEDETDIDVEVVFVFISNLRRKIKSIDSKIEIKSFRGKGYQLECLKK